jgi:hypothetical protein
MLISAILIRRMTMTRVAEDIAEIKTDVKWLIGNSAEHRAEHSKIRMMMYTALVGVCISLMVSYVTVKARDFPLPAETVSLYEEVED